MNRLKGKKIEGSIIDITYNTSRNLKNNMKRRDKLKNAKVEINAEKVS